MLRKCSVQTLDELRGVRDKWWFLVIKASGRIMSHSPN